jgi:ATP-dependent DNA helicase PIF1
VQVHRQTDNAMVDLLQHLRYVDFDLEHLDYVVRVLRGCHEPLSGDGVTRIYAHNQPVDEYNRQQLATLPGPTRCFRAVDTIMASDDAQELQQGPLPLTLEVRVGAQVICVLNNNRLQLVNGDRGTVTHVHPDGVTVSFESGAVKRVPQIAWTTPGGSERRQVPLRLAWAITVHRVQGLVRVLLARPTLLPP